MTLAQSILATDRKLTLEIRINNVLLTPSDPTSATGIPASGEVRITNRIGTGAICTLDVSRTATWITSGMSVTVDVGYDGFKNRRFTGTVQDRGKGIGRGRVTCSGTAFPLGTTSIIPDQDFTGDTTAQAITAVLDYVGITNRSISTTSGTVIEFTLGSAVAATLKNMSAAQMLQQIMELQGCEWFETGAGIVTIRVMDRIPAPTAFRTYTTNDNSTARILSSEFREDRTYVRTRVKVTGATIAGTGDPSTTLTATATVAGVSPLVKPALPSGSYIDAGVFNSLADTQAKVDAMALYYLTQWHRVPGYLDIEIPGDPQIECGMTLGLVIPEQDINGRFFVDGWEDTITMPSGEEDDTAGYRTILSGLRGGDLLGGTLTIAPTASFTMQVEREVFGTGTTDFVVVTLDATSSADADGTIASYLWTSNKTTTPSMASSVAAVRTVRIDSASLDGSGTDWTITLQVTDNSGATGTVTQTVPYPTTAGLVTIPAIGVAYNSGFGFSPDGAQHWNTITGATCISVAMRPSDGVHFGHAVFGFSNGVIKRTTDGGLTSATEYTLASGAAINCLAWDWRNTNVVWALSNDMQLLISVDAGDTWSIYDALRTTLSLAGAIAGRRSIGLPVDGGVYVFGGDGVGNPLIAFDPVVGSHVWTRVTLTGDLTTDMPADATLKIVDYSAPGYGTEVMILSFASGGGASIQPIYSTTSAPGTSRAFTRATGLTAGLKNGVYVVGDAASNGDGIFRAAFGDRDTWSTVDGIAWTKTANVMPANVTPNDCIWAAGVLTGLPEFSGLYLVAAQINAGDTVGLYKSADGLQTVTALWPAGGSWPAWPASGKGKYVSIGAPGNSLAGGSDLVYVQQSDVNGSATTYERRVGLLSSVIWSLQANPAAASQLGIVKLKRLGANLYRVVSTGGFTVGNNMRVPGQLQRSTDNGVTFSDVGPAPVTSGSDHYGVIDITIDGSGSLWLNTSPDTNNAVAGMYPRIYRSTDDGATWTEVFSDTTTSGGLWLNMVAIAAHPTNNNIIATMGGTGLGVVRTWHSLDASAVSPTFTLTTGSVNQNSAGNRRLVVLTSNRLVSLNSTVGVPAYSDDYGANWTAGSSLFSSRQYFLLQTPGDILLAGGGSSTATQVYRSSDAGITWTQLVDDSTLIASVTGFQGGVYSDSGTLYLATDTDQATNRVLAIDNAATVAPTPTLRDVTFNLDSLLSGSADVIGMNCIAV